MSTHSSSPAADFAAFVENTAHSLGARAISIYRTNRDNPDIDVLLEWRASGPGGNFRRFTRELQAGTLSLVLELADPDSGYVPESTIDRLLLAALDDWSANELARARSEVTRLNRRLSERKVVERAKGLLQTQRGLDEEQAYAHLRRTSRQRRISIAAISEELLRCR